MAFSNAPQYSTYQQKTVPFYGEPLLRSGLTTKDQRFWNCFPEAYKNQNTGDKNFYLRKRFGLQTVGAINPAEVRGAYSYEGTIYYVAGNGAYSYVGGVSTLLGVLGTSTGDVGIRDFSYYGDNEEIYILFADGTTLYNYKISTGVMAANPAGYPTPHSPYFEVMDGYILMSKTGTADIYNSQVSDWSLTWDFITAEMYPDKLLGLSRYNNYIMAMGTESCEMFYDAAIEDGSPFQRNDSVIATIGCKSMGTVLQTDRKFFWVGTTKEGDVSVWTMDEFKPVEIASYAVKQAISANLAASTRVQAYSVRVQGHHFYVLRLALQTWVFDIDEKIWHQWDYNGQQNWPIEYAAESINGQFIGFFGSVAVWFNPDYYTDLNGSIPIQTRWQTQPLDFETMNRKFLNRLTLVGDRENTNTTVLVQWTDDNYNTFSAARGIDLTKPRPAFVNGGYFRRRAFFFYTESATPMRLEGMELSYNSGVN